MPMSYESRFPDFATMRRTMGRLTADQGSGYIPCPDANCRGTLEVVDDEMACTACANGERPFPSTGRSS